MISVTINRDKPYRERIKALKRAGIDIYRPYNGIDKGNSTTYSQDERNKNNTELLNSALGKHDIRKDVRTFSKGTMESYE